MKNEHTHEITRENFIFHPRNRKLPENLQEKAVEMLKVGGKAADIAFLMMAKNGNIVLSKDLHNLKESSKMTESEAAE